MNFRGYCYGFREGVSILCVCVCVCGGEGLRE